MIITHQTIQVSESDLIPFTEKCLICGNNGTRKVIRVLQLSPRVDYLGCPSCGGCSASRMPTKEFLDGYYQVYYGEKTTKVEFVGHIRFSRHILRLAHEIVTRPTIRILDFGGGDGTLALTIARKIRKRTEVPIQIEVVDYSAQEAITEPGIDLVPKHSLSEADGTFDLVLASAVLEHIPDLGETLQALLHKLSPAGFFYARTPYSLPLKRVFPRLDLLFPMHVHDLGPEFWSNVKKTFEFQGRVVVSKPSIVQTDFLSNPFQTTIAHLLKFPSHLEQKLTGTLFPKWRFVGGWEVVLQRT